MNPIVLVSMALLAAALPPDVLRSILATAASTLFESVPFILAAALLARVPVRWTRQLLPFLGCGCGAGCSARSLPAAAVSAVAFGPLVAIARVVAATLADRILHPTTECNRAERDAPLTQLASLAPFALLGGAIAPAWGAFGHAPAPPIAAAAGAALAFVLAPCALGAVGIAGALHATSPIAAAGFLCVAGIIDARALLGAPHLRVRDDAAGYALAAVAVAIVAWHHGAALVHPRFTIAMWASAAGLAAMAFAYRPARSRVARLAPMLMLVAAVLGAPQPAYRASETTLADAFAGERVDFTGVLVRDGGTPALVRYAITCCRADAAPVVIRLQREPAYSSGWIHARGTLVSERNALVLRVERASSIDAPTDPYIYR